MRSSLSSSLFALLVAVGSLTACADASSHDQLTAPSFSAGALERSDNMAGSVPGAITTKLDDNMCVDVPGAGKSDRSRVVLWRCSGGPSQQWTYTADRELRVHGDMCLDAPNGHASDRDRLIISACDGGANQQWDRTSAGEFRGIGGKCVDLAGGRVENGTHIVLYRCHGQANQWWNTTAPAVADPAADDRDEPATAPTPPDSIIAPAPAPPDSVVAPAPAPPAAPVVISNPSDGAAKVLALMGAVPSVSAVEALGGAFGKYERDFPTYAERHWVIDGSNWGTANYYDRALIYYVWWARTGNTAYLQRAHAIAVNYRTNYLEAQNYKASPHWAQLDGLALHYLLTGDEASRTAVGRVADEFSALYYVENLGRTNAEMENRMQARVLMSYVLANHIKAPSRMGQDWAMRSRDALTKILATQSSDGAYRLTGPINQCGYNKPWMVGLLNDAMIRYHTLFERDGRILPSIKKAVDYMWANDWRSGSNAFVYLAGPCNGNPVGVAPDLNNLITSGFGFVYQQSGDVTYRARGDAVFAGAVAGSFLSGSKQFNQQYTSSLRYLDLRQ